MIKFLKQFFTWWNSQTLNSRVFMWWKGAERVGQDEFGNVYYRAKSAIPDSIAEHRWVVYNGYSEASAIPPGWHGWMHHKTDVLPSAETYRPRDWQKPHQPNPTGTARAYRPPGSIVGNSRPAPTAPDYQAWKPE